MHGFWYGFGEHDGWNMWEAPDNVSMASVVLAIGAGGALRSCETAVLLSVEETLEARYRPTLGAIETAFDYAIFSIMKRAAAVGVSPMFYDGETGQGPCACTA